MRKTPRLFLSLSLCLLSGLALSTASSDGIGLDTMDGPDEDYIESNSWQSEFEGLAFIEEDGSGGRAPTMLDSDYSDEGEEGRTNTGADTSANARGIRPPDMIREAFSGDENGERSGTTGTTGTTTSTAADLQHLYDDAVDVNMDDLLANKNKQMKNKLPSFEETPMPKKPTLAQWRKEKRRKRIRNESPPFELTSSLYLVPGVKGYVGACTVVRDDHDYIIEWVNHHLSLGVRPLYIYDHRSLPPLEQFLRPYIADGRVVLERFEADKDFGGASPQLYAYDDCLRRRGPEHQWLAFLDVDEFLMFRNSHPIQSLGAFLKDYEDYSALAVHWILFGSSDYESKPLRSALRSYTRCMPLRHTQHLFVKSIVNTRCTTHTSDSPHSFAHNCTAPVVRTDGSPIQGATASDAPVHDTLVIHHYATKSLEDFEMKVLKGSGMRRGRGWDYFYFVDGWSTEFNFEGLKIWNDDVVTRTRTLDPATIQQQLAGYSQETLEDFWGNSQVTEDEVRETVDGDLSWGDAGEEEPERGRGQGRGRGREEVPSVSDDADEGEW